MFCSPVPPYGSNIGAKSTPASVRPVPCRQRACRLQRRGSSTAQNPELKLRTPTDYAQGSCPICKPFSSRGWGRKGKACEYLCRMGVVHTHTTRTPPQSEQIQLV